MLVKKGWTMSKVIHCCSGGEVILPTRVLCDRQDGGHLIVNPPRRVWERSCLTPLELARWSLLVAATGRAMLDVLPVLRDGCLNYWEAGNWALNDRAEPVGPKSVETHRRVHLHIFGRRRDALDPDWRWGESPKFPDFAESESWASRFQPLTPSECDDIAARLLILLETDFRLPELADNTP